LDYIQDLFKSIDLYQAAYPQPEETVKQQIEELDLEYIREDFPNLMASMQEGVKRINDISTSLRTFSRSDSDRPVTCNIHEGIDSTTLILKHRLKASEGHPAISIVKNYGQLPLVKCYAGQLNQVFMNILANAIDVLEVTYQAPDSQLQKVKLPQITISTEYNQKTESVIIRIGDNGIGMSEQVKAKIFDHLFTTKAVGKGTGLGLAIAKQIIVEKHQGEITVNSTHGEGTEFAITLPIYLK
jgi:signal transduction histidine kinase